MFSEDSESKVDQVEIKFMHPKIDGFWDWPKKIDQKLVSSKFVFYGPCIPEAPTRRGFKFSEEENLKLFYKVFRDSLKN